MATNDETQEKDVIARLADKGEEAIARLGELPGGAKVAKGLNELRDRVEDLSRRVRGVDALEKRVEALERQLDEVRRGQPAEEDPTAGPQGPLP